jgi:hypothetical protein
VRRSLCDVRRFASCERADGAGGGGSSKGALRGAPPWPSLSTGSSFFPIAVVAVQGSVYSGPRWLFQGVVFRLCACVFCLNGQGK